MEAFGAAVGRSPRGRFLGMTQLPRLILSRDHLFHGTTLKELARRAKTGTLHRVRQGAYVDGAAWAAMKPWEQYRVQVSAAAETSTARTIFARHSAASVWGIPTIGVHHPVQALTLQNDGGRSRAGISRHFADPAGLKVYRCEGLLVTDRVRTVLDLAAFTPFVESGRSGWNLHGSGHPENPSGSRFRGSPFRIRGGILQPRLDACLRIRSPGSST